MFAHGTRRHLSRSLNLAALHQIIIVHVFGKKLTGRCKCEKCPVSQPMDRLVKLRSRLMERIEKATRAKALDKLEMMEVVELGTEKKHKRR